MGTSEEGTFRLGQEVCGGREDITGGTTRSQLRLDVVENFLGVRDSCIGGNDQVGPGSLPHSSHDHGTHCIKSGVRLGLCTRPRALQTFRACEGGGRSPRQRQRLQREWKMAKIELLVILLFVLSWAPYSIVALMAFAG